MQCRVERSRRTTLVVVCTGILVALGPTQLGAEHTTVGALSDEGATQSVIRTDEAPFRVAGVRW